MLDFKKDTLKFPGHYRGTVVSNTDPSSLGRIKVEIYTVYDGIAAADIPWAVPAFPLFSGAGSGFGSFAIPEVGSIVWCFFENEEVYQPVYFAAAPDSVHGLPSERTTNYPGRKVWKTKNGITIIVDDSAKEVYVNHPSGTSVVIDTDGKIILTGGDVSIIGEAVVIEGTTVDINP